MCLTYFSNLYYHFIAAIAFCQLANSQTSSRRETTLRRGGGELALAKKRENRASNIALSYSVTLTNHNFTVLCHQVFGDLNLVSLSGFLFFFA